MGYCQASGSNNSHICLVPPAPQIEPLMSAFVFVRGSYLNASKAKYAVEVCSGEQNLVGVDDEAASFYPLLSNEFYLVIIIIFNLLDNESFIHERQRSSFCMKESEAFRKQPQSQQTRPGCASSGALSLID